MEISAEAMRVRVGAPNFSKWIYLCDMKSRLILISLVLIPAVLVSSAFAQRNNPLGKDVEDFMEKLTPYFLSDPNLDRETKSEIEKQSTAYLAFYQSLPASLQEKIAEIGRQSYAARLRAYPEFWQFLQLQQKMHGDYTGSQQAWLDALLQMLKKSRPRHFQTLVEATDALLRNRQLYKSNAAFWRVSNTDFTFRKEPEPAFYFSDINLSCHAYQDSMFIYGTSGVYYPMNDRFEGKGGDAYWPRAGFSPDSCRTRLLHYTINLHQGSYEASEAELLNLHVFPQPLRGRFTDRLTTGRQGNYPQFVSESAALSINNIFPGVDIVGPFVQQGSKTHFGSGDRQAVLYVREDDWLRAKIQTSRCIVERGQISASEAYWVMYLENDSLYNPAVSVRFDAKTRVMHVGQVEKYGLDVPYIDTYHQLRMDFESMRWYIDRKKVEIGLLNVPGRVGVVSFKSLNLYSREELGRMLLGVDNNPLYALAAVAKRERKKELPLDKVASALNLSGTQALAMLRYPVAFGFVSYDPVKKTVLLLPQLFHNLEVSAGKADSDDIEFNTSENGIIKAVLRLDSLDIRMTGVSYVNLSEKQNVYLKPLDSVVEIFKNRDFHFDGLLHAGTFNFTVRGACFYYDDFKVDIADVERLGLEVIRMEDGEEKRHPVSSLIRSLSGTVYIDDPGNKGGRKNFDRYPVFESTQPSYVYYDDADIQNGAYTPDSFYFKVDPFRMERLYTIDMDSIRFKGTLVSAGIFPDIEEALVIRPDYSLGFQTSSPQNGWPAYQGKALYTGEVSLDRRGLRGKGDFDYLTSRASSPVLTFLPSRMFMKAKEFRLKQAVSATVSYPDIDAGSVNCTFEKSSGLYTVASIKDSLLRCFSEPWLLSGKYTFSASLSSAKGTFIKRNEARLSSAHFEVRTNTFSSDSGDFRLTAGGSNHFLYSAPHAMQVDLKAKHASFQAPDGHSPLSFGLNQYEGKAASLEWDMDAKTVAMTHGNAATAEKQAGLDTMAPGALYTCALPGENFVSTRRAQDGLNFNATQSTLFYADTLLQFNGVKRVLVADALFVPDEERVEIEPSGQVRPLANAELFFGDRNRLHAFHQVRANVLSARQYRASGMFDYNAPEIEPQHVWFAGIRPSSEGYSQAAARISADSGALMLNEAFQFIGKINLDAQQTYPYFSGSVRMVYACNFEGKGAGTVTAPTQTRQEEPNYDEFEYSEAEEGEEAEPSVKEQRDPAGEWDAVWEDAGKDEPQKAETSKKGRKKGVEEEIPSEEASHLKPGNPFLADGIQFASLINPDSVLIPVTDKTRSTVGRLLGCGFYTQSRSGIPRFLFMSHKVSTDLPNIALTGWLNFSHDQQAYRMFDSTGREALSVNVRTCFAKAFGAVDLRLNTYEFHPFLYGDMMTDADRGEISVRGLGIFDFYLTSEVQKQIAGILNGNPQLERAEITKRKGVAAYLEEKSGRRVVERMKEDVAVTGVMTRIPEALSQSLVFSDLALEWEPARKAYIGSGKAELLAVGGTPVNKKLKVFVSLRKTRKGDVADIYMEAAPNAWFYFSYTNHYMQLVTSSEQLNNHIMQLKGRSRKKGRYEFYLSTMSKRNTFVNGFMMRE